MPRFPILQSVLVALGLLLTPGAPQAADEPLAPSLSAIVIDPNLFPVDEERCGDHFCSPGERRSCPTDCGLSFCGDGYCGPGESRFTCFPDCLD